MTGIGMTSALIAGSIAGLLAAAVVPAYNILFGLGVAVGGASLMLMARAVILPEEDTEPEIRPPDFRQRDGSRAAGRSGESDY
jgi:hypothetical protein